MSDVKMKELIEKLADIEHQRWSSWQIYMHSRFKESRGDFIVPGVLVEHWERQIKTNYKDLTEREKEEDRKQVRRYLPLIEAHFDSLTSDKEALIEALEGLRGKVEAGSIALGMAHEKFEEGYDKCRAIVKTEIDLILKQVGK